MINKFTIAISFLVLFITMGLLISTQASSDHFYSCQSNSDIIDATLGESLISIDEFDPIIDVALQGASCADLKSGTCGLGECKNGWKCKDTGIQCVCFPPE